MKKTIFFAGIALLALLGTSCASKQDEPEVVEENQSTESEMTTVTNSEGHITHAQAVDRVMSSNTLKGIVADYPSFLDGVEFYTTQQVTTLEDARFGFPLNETIFKFYEMNVNMPVWQVLIHCAETCDKEKFLLALNEHSPAIPEEGINEDFDSFFIIVGAENGEIVMYERGPGVFTNESSFQQHWTKYN